MEVILKKDEEEKSGRNWILSSIFAAIIIIPLTKLIASDLIPFDYLGVWDDHGTSFGDAFQTGKWLLFWGFLLSLVFSLWKKWQGERADASKGEVFLEGLIISLKAGVLEELAFRWFLFYGAFAGIAITNFLLLGFIDLGIIEAIHNYVLGPLANITTFGQLESYLFHEHSWLVGAAMLSTNAFFRDGHKYQGLLGYINSWFGGMFLFYIMFSYGLLAAIVIHFLYDVVCFTTSAAILGE